MAYTTIDDPSAYFQTKIYAGNGSTNALTFDGNSNMKPDWLWIKVRNGSNYGVLHDSVRGVNKRLELRNVSETTVTSVSSFNTDGFTLSGNDGFVNTSDDSATYVGWGWSAGTSFTNDASGTGIGTIDSAGSFNNDAGFSIVSYTGTGSNGTIKHGLSSIPKMIITKKRSASQGWHVQHASLGATKELYLNTTDAAATGSTPWNNTTPTASVFSVGTSGGTNGSSATYIAYCFAEKQGYSKFGSYTGNGNADGTFIYTGFKPSWVMRKKSSAASQWTINDTARDPFNMSKKGLTSNSNAAEDDANGYWDMDFLSNGFKMRTTETEVNGSGATFIYMAFAENPFVTSTGIPATAR